MEMTDTITETVGNLVLHPNLHTALAIFTVSFVNELVAVLPYNVILSGQLVFLKEPISVALISQLFFYVALPVGLGTTLGSLPVFAVAYFGGKPAIDRFGKYLRFSWEHVEKIESKLKGSWYDEILFLSLRSVPFLPALPFNIASGILRMRIVPYLVLTFVGTLIKMMIMLLFFGYGALGVESLIGD